MRPYILWPTVASVAFSFLIVLAIYLLAITTGFHQFYFTDAYNAHDGSPLNIFISAVFVTGMIGCVASYSLALHAERMHGISPWIVYILGLMTALSMIVTMSVPGGNAGHGYVATTACIVSLWFVLLRGFVGIRHDIEHGRIATRRIVQWFIFAVAFTLSCGTAVFYFFDSLVFWFSIFQTSMGGVLFIGVVVPLFFSSFEPKHK